MKTRKLALLTTVLIATGGLALAQQAEDTTPGAADDDFVQEGTQALETDGTIAEDMRQPSSARSVSRQQEPYAGTVFGGMQADELIGMDVVDAEGQNIGSVSDLLIGENNEIDRAIVDVGGFLGFGSKPIAVDIDELSVAEGEGEVVLGLSQAQLQAMPEWQENETGWFTE